MTYTEDEVKEKIKMAEARVKKGHRQYNKWYLELYWWVLEKLASRKEKEVRTRRNRQKELTRDNVRLPIKPK